MGWGRNRGWPRLGQLAPDRGGGRHKPRAEDVICMRWLGRKGQVKPRRFHRRLRPARALVDLSVCLLQSGPPQATTPTACAAASARAHSSAMRAASAAGTLASASRAPRDWPGRSRMKRSRSPPVDSAEYSGTMLGCPALARSQCGDIDGHRGSSAWSAAVWLVPDDQGRARSAA